MARRRGTRVTPRMAPWGPEEEEGVIQKVTNMAVFPWSGVTRRPARVTQSRVIPRYVVVVVVARRRPGSFMTRLFCLGATVR